VSSDVVTFLHTRFDEDEFAAEAAIHQTPHWDVGYDGHVVERIGPGYHFLAWTSYDPAEGGGSEASGHIARWDPARVLAEVAAKRAIIGVCLSWDVENKNIDWSAPFLPTGEGDNAHLVAREVLLALASTYEDHPPGRDEGSVHKMHFVTPGSPGFD
jgi:hypothetical protein